MAGSSSRVLVSVVAASAACILAAGCSRSSHEPVYPVHGQVLLNGKPLPQAIVTFHQQSGADKALPSAQTDADGRFILTSYQPGDGAPEGEYAISLVCFRTREIRKGDDDTARNIVPARYANAATSKLTAKIVPGDNQLEPLQLKIP
jgi:hypothetical protein